MLDLLYKRRSVRKFTDKAISEEQKEKLSEALLLSPSGKNKRPWRFLLIEDGELIKLTADAKPHGTKALDTAPLAIVIVGLTDKSDVYIEDCSIASILVQLEAESLGLGSCWIQIRNRLTSEGVKSEDYLRERLKLAETESVEAIIAVGHPSENHAAYTKDGLDFTKIERR